MRCHSQVWKQHSGPFCICEANGGKVDLGPFDDEDMTSSPLASEDSFLWNFPRDAVHNTWSVFSSELIDMSGPLDAIGKRWPVLENSRRCLKELYTCGIRVLTWN